MKAGKNNVIGALHPVLFFVVFYCISLLAAIFICSTLFYSCNVQTRDTDRPLPKIHMAELVIEKPVIQD